MKYFNKAVLAVLLAFAMAAQPALATNYPANPNGQALPANSAPVTLAAPNTVTASAYTRPGNTTAYVAGQLIGNSTSAATAIQFTGLAPANGVPVYVTKMKLLTSTSGGAGVTITAGVFRVHLFGQAPTISGNDGATFSNTMANWCGTFDGTLTYQGTDASVMELVPTYGAYVACTPAGGSTNLFGLIEARGAFTPTNAETFTVSATAQ